MLRLIRPTLLFNTMNSSLQSKSPKDMRFMLWLRRLKETESLNVGHNKLTRDVARLSVLPGTSQRGMPWDL